MDSGIHALGDIYGDEGLRSFQELSVQFNLPKTTFYFYLQLRSTLKAHGVPWQAALSDHPLYRTICSHRGTRGLVSTIYSHILQKSYCPLGLDTVWRADIPDLDLEFDWNAVWANILLSSRNPDHQQIHLNVVHRTYLTPRRRCEMRITDDPNCTLCPLNVVGTFFHMMWECPDVLEFWDEVASKLSNLLSVIVPRSPTVLLLNDLSTIHITKHRKRLLLAGLTAAKRMIALRWKPPHLISVRLWILSFLDIIYLEQSVARIHGACEANVALWTRAANGLTNLLS